MDTIFQNFLVYRDGLTSSNVSTTPVVHYLQENKNLYEKYQINDIKANFKFQINKFELNIFYLEILLQLMRGNYLVFI